MSFVIASIAHAQGVDSGARYGAFLNGALPIQSGNFRYVPTCPVCGNAFRTGTGFGLDFGALHAMPLSSKYSLELRLGYHDLGATLNSTEVTQVIDQNDQLVNGTFVNTLRTKIGMIGLSPLIAYHPSMAWRLLAGPTIGLVTSKIFEEREEVTQPSNGVFVDGNGNAVGRVRNDYSGSIPDASRFMAAITIGSQYELPMNATGTMHLVPEAFFTYGVTPLAKGMSWRASSITAGVSIEYTPTKVIPTLPPLPQPPPAPQPPPVKPKMPSIAASLEVEGVEVDQTVHPIRELVIEDYIRTQYRPLLNYIFFDKGTSELPARYHRISDQETRNYDFHRFSDLETLPLYYEALNIYGQRMRAFPKGRLTIIGCNDGGDEKAINGLSQSRAKAVFDYLHDVWGIKPSRMKLEYRTLPEKPSSISDTGGLQENRRVEITSNLWQIMEPIFTTDTAHVPKPPILRAEPKEVAEAGVARWLVTVQDDKNVASKTFTGSDTVQHTLDWDLQNVPGTRLKNLGSIQARFELSDRSGQEVHSEPVQLPARHYTLLDKHHEGSIDTIISRYNLILFDFNRSELSDANARISALVRSRTTAESKVKVFGYTDRIGSDEYNFKLSTSRAQATAQSIYQKNASAYHSLDVRGLGRSVLLYDNSLPEGRFYSRTVTVEVTTPTN
ncbi:MAG: OmpA family protein [Bacteroidota bacterium]|nr:OmpA family protein [Bacteroidota bacterium]MDP4242148.1 OmpA family protein [Bacteroidota bacterium]MDP4287797.1 OmpA family protein [Bacteroidota bacterium]